MASPHLYDQSVDGGRTTLAGRGDPGVGSRVDRRRHAPRPAAQQPGRRADRRSPQRREPRRLPAAPGLPAVPQPRRGRRQGRARAPATPLEEIFAEAQRVVRWHHQWLVLHEFLPKTVGQAMVDDVLSDGAEVLHVAQRPVHPRGVLGRRLPLRPLPGPPQLPRQLRDQRHGRRRSSSSRCSSTPAPPIPATRPTCAGDAALRAASSTGRPSSTSATAGCAPTRRSTPSSPRCCSTFSGSRRASRSRWPPATCCAT